VTATSSIRPITVSDYTGRIARAVRHVGAAVIEGEVQKVHPARSGVFYFDLTDGEAKVCCKVFRAQAARLEHVPATGDLVQVAIERPDFWPKAGKLDLIVASVRLAGEGELLRRRAELLERLRFEGLCDPARRKPLPRFPRAVGLIAGKNSDARSDVVRALEDRFPSVHIVACDALVQGKAAPRDIIDALAYLQEHPLVDVIVIARGGGATQDLAAFDDERLCRALFACDAPVVAAIGHSDNAPVCNHVTHAAYTPSRSAELAVPSVAELRQEIALARQTLYQAPARIDRKLEQLEAVRGRLNVPARLEHRTREVVDRSQRITSAEGHFFSAREGDLAEARATLNTIPFRARAALFKRERELGAAGEQVDLTDRIDALASSVAEQTRRLGAGIARQLVDHEHDYGRALTRLVIQTKGAVIRRLSNHVDRVAAGGELVRERVGRRLGDGARELGHLTRLIEARDFRRRGFVLAADGAGRPVSSASALRCGAPLTLIFEDGLAKAVVNDIVEESR
jgi:exodeoxyribonuclease VII large subunit